MASCIPPPGPPRPQYADRRFFPGARGGAWQSGARGCSVGNRVGWDAWPPGDQGSGRSHLRAGSSGPRSLRACREAPSPPAWRILSSRRPELRGNWRPSRAMSQVPGEPGESTEPVEDAELAKILRLVRSATGVDFTNYKPSTLPRRIKRRMALRGFEGWKITAGISSRIARKQGLVRGLSDHRHGILSGTGGLRGAEEAACSPCLFENRGAADPIRIWVPGCATGEEAYSIAICLMEFLEEAKAERSVRDFRHRYQRNGHRKSPRRHIHGRRAGPRLAAAACRGSSPDRNAGTRWPRASATYAFLPGTTWPRTRLSPSWTSSVAATC